MTNPKHVLHFGLCVNGSVFLVFAFCFFVCEDVWVSAESDLHVFDVTSERSNGVMKRAARRLHSSRSNFTSFDCSTFNA